MVCKSIEENLNQVSSKTANRNIKFFIHIQGLFAVMAMATSAIELPDNKYDNSNSLADYHQPEEGYLAYNPDHSVPTSNWAYSVPSDTSQQHVKIAR